MGQLVSPKVFHVGQTEMNYKEIHDYLEYTKQTDFIKDMDDAIDEGRTGGEIICSMFAKMCYKSLVVGKNANVRKVRAVTPNLESCFETGHGSIFEHFLLNFVVTDCSRVFTHELVRHRAGTAFSQTSGRYCRLDSIDLVWDPILDPVKDLWTKGLEKIEDLVYLTECQLKLRKPPNNEITKDFTIIDPSMFIKCRDNGQPKMADSVRWVPDDSFDFNKRKKITSAIRRIAPNGQSNEIAFSVNVRALRQTIQLRTSEFAEYEIREIFGQIYHLIASRFPLMFYKAKTKVIDGLIKVYGMKTQPFEIEGGDPKALQYWTTDQLSEEIFKRAHDPSYKDYEGAKQKVELNQSNEGERN